VKIFIVVSSASYVTKFVQNFIVLGFVIKLQIVW